MASPAAVGEVAAVRPDLSIPEQHLTAETDKNVDYVVVPKASRQWANVLLYLGKAGYDIKLVHTDSFTRACHRLSGPSPTPLVQPPSISSMAQLLISSTKRSRICYLYTQSSPFCHF